MRKIVIASVLAAVAAGSVSADVGRPFDALAKGRPVLCVNADNDHFFKAEFLLEQLPLEWRFTERGLDRYLDIVTDGGKGAVTHYFMCTVGQRASYDSKACDPIWFAIEEAELIGLKPNEWPVNAKKLHDAGLDCYAYWIPRLRERGVSPWISMRMNDAHHLNRVWNIRTNRFWYNHPELRRDRGKDPTRFWTGELSCALDYSLAPVQDFEFGIFKELVDRYDADGFELDWMRHGQHLTPGKEREQAHFLTYFIRRCRAYADAKAKERGHPIQLSVRVPTTYESAREWGYDPETWAREGLVEMIAPANFYDALDYDFDFTDWKRRIEKANPRVAVVPSGCDCINCGASRPVESDTAARRGWADNMYAKGADALYFFNVAYGSYEVQRELYRNGFPRGSTAKGERRYLSSYHDFTAESVPEDRCFPRKYTEGATASIFVGQRPAADERVEVVVIGWGDADTWQVKLNGRDPIDKPVSRIADLARYAAPTQWKTVALGFAFPADAVRAGRNEIRVLPPGGDGHFFWCELSVK